MSFTVGAALKKVAVAVLSDKKVFKKVCIIVLTVSLVFIMPIFAIVSFFKSKIELSDENIAAIIANLDVEEVAKLTKVNDTMEAIEEAMTDADLREKYTEAQVLYILALYEHQDEDNFVERLVSCYQNSSSDEGVIKLVNREFGCDIKPEEYIKVVSGMRQTTISNSIFEDPTTKNNHDVVAWAENAYRSHWGYVWGTYGRVLTKDYCDALVNRDPKHVGIYEDFIRSNWVGRRCSDCVGLIKGYLWYNPNKQEIQYRYGNAPDGGANSMYASAKIKGPISTIPEIPGLGVWHKGHVGIYIGNGYVIQAKGTKYGVVKTGLKGFTHWFKIPGVTYLDE